MRVAMFAFSQCVVIIAVIWCIVIFAFPRCVVCRDGVAVEMSFDHKPEDEVCLCMQAPQIYVYWF